MVSIGEEALVAALSLFCERAWVDYPFETCIGLPTYIIPLVTPDTYIHYSPEPHLCNCQPRSHLSWWHFLR